MTASNMTSDSITTSDGVTIRYITAGPTSGPVLLFVPGWCQTAIQWKKQIAHFSDTYRVIAIDHRGHGDSGKPSGGYRIARLAADLHELITQLDLKNAVIIGHSMGCSVFWSYWDTFSDSRTRVSKVVLADQGPCMAINPAWEGELATSLAAIWTPSFVFELAGALAGPGGEEQVAAVLRTLYTSSISDEDFSWTTEQCLKADRTNVGSTLLINHATQDWRDVIPTINIPTLVIGAEESPFNKKALEWVAAQIQGSELEIFTKEEQGSHFMFWENEKKFNQVVKKFLQK
ncbi:AB hydrolase superfamily YdjP-like protein [Cladobotryum mycophilum]|uniref:AB hydrolase superfamily YdjP-like protein n=1 Tax=Cladobotryum mycophilum TaxID=491253 RepID=A0ABR0STQ1_9HYPO